MARHLKDRIGIPVVKPSGPGRGKGLVRKPTTVGRRKVTIKRKIV